MRHTSDPGPPRLPTPEEVELLGFVPLVAPFFRESRVRAEMPELMRRTMEEHGLTPRHGAVLPQLLASERPLTVGELARRMRVSLPTASELVGALDRAGVVERSPDPENRRRVLVSLTPAFRPAVERLVTARAAPLLRALDTLSPRDRAGFRAGLEAWAREVQDQGAVT